MTTQLKKSVITTKQISWWQLPINTWNNLSLRIKITTLLMLGATIPVIAVTQGIVEIARQEAIVNLQEVLKVNLVLLDDEIYLQKKQLEATVNTLALSVEIANINTAEVIDNPQLQILQSVIEATQKQQPNASFYIITDDQGRTVAQYIQTIKGDFSGYPALPTKDSVKPEFEPINLTTGIPLADVPIIENTLKLSRSLSGFELINGEVLQRLGLDKQANIGIRKQKIEGLPEQKKPFPKGTFNVDDGKMGFVLMATQPIRLANNKVGTAIVGTLVNRNFEIVDRLRDVTRVSTATIFAQDWRVSTNVPYTDQKTRAIGTRVSREVAEAVLKNSQVFIGDANIIGIDYVTGYSPIYDHRKQIDENKATPVGIAYVGEPQLKVIENLRKITFTGYVVGGGVLLIFGIILIVTPSDTGISRQLRQLTEFASKVAASESGVRLEKTDRQDEIGVLTRSLNEMAKNVDANFETQKQETERQQQQKELLEKEIIQLIDELQDAVDGDLTVRASLSSMEMSTVADLFNAIIDSLRDIAIQVKESSTEVTSALQDNQESIQLLEQLAVEETEQARNTLASVEKMSDSIEQVANNANQAAHLADDAYQETQAGTNAMDETVSSILNVRSTVGETAKKIKRLGESSQKIAEVVSLIEDIALKTNLLAINASVEASRAGEQGQGFTVVAEQVGVLAEQSKKATKKIANIITIIQAQTQEVAQAMELSTSQVVDTTNLVDSTKQRLLKVLERSNSINELMKTISQSTVSQAETSKTVTELMQKIAQQSEARLISSAEITKSIQATAEVAQQMESTVKQFKVISN
jgi:methyl-accepting chemotaxis protein